MAWPHRVYAATATLGIYYTEAFTGSGDQPVWGTVNGGLPATTVTAFTVDPSATPSDTRMYCIVGGTIYKRTIGDWSAVLTSAAARTAASVVADEALEWLAVDPVTGYVYSLLASRTEYVYSGIFLMRSTDYGETWGATRVHDTQWPSLYFGLGGLDAYNGLVVCGYLKSAAGHRNGYSTDHGVTWSTVEVGGQSAPASIPVRINPLLASKWYGGRFGYSSYYDLIRVSTLAVLEDLNPGDATGGYSQGGYWFDPDDVDHMLTMYTSDAVEAVETADSFATNPPRNTVSVTYTTELAEQSQDAFWVHGNASPSALASRAPVYVSTDGYTLTHRSGAAWDSTPYADSIPATCGGVIQRGLWAVFDAPTEGPTPPPGSTITPPGGSPITLGGTGNVQGVTMPDYTGNDRGVPLPGDRSAWDETLYGSLHARDIKDGAFIHHMNPLDPRASQADFVAHTEAANPHETALDDLTDVDAAAPNNGDALVWNNGDSEWQPLDVLTPAEHTAIGNSSPHHAAVTLGAGNNAALALSGQELTLTMSSLSSGEVLMADGVTAPPVPIETEAQDDWLYEG